MKISRISIKLFILAAIFWSSVIYAGIASRNYDIEKEKIEREKGGFIFFHGYEELNYWDQAQIGLFILAGASTVATIWLRKENY